MCTLPPCRVSELIAQHEAQRQEDQLALQEKEKRITELEKKLDLKTQEEQKLELQRRVSKDSPSCLSTILCVASLQPSLSRQSAELLCVLL